MLIDHNEIKLGIHCKRNYSNTWRLYNKLLNDQWVIEEIRKEINSQTQMKMKAKGSAKMKVYCYIKKIRYQTYNDATQAFRKTRTIQMQN
jgi:hypothetical protein